jgi:hypothetical protein
VKKKLGWWAAVAGIVVGIGAWSAPSIFAEESSQDQQNQLREDGYFLAGDSGGVELWLTKTDDGGVAYRTIPNSPCDRGGGPLMDPAAETQAGYFPLCSDSVGDEEGLLLLVPKGTETVTAVVDEAGSYGLNVFDTPEDWPADVAFAGRLGPSFSTDVGAAGDYEIVITPEP